MLPLTNPPPPHILEKHKVAEQQQVMFQVPRIAVIT